MEEKNDVEIKTDYIERNLKVKQYNFYFRLGNRLFKLTEDVQVSSTILYAIDDYKDNLGIISLKGRPLNLEGYYLDGSEFTSILFKNEE